MKLFPITSAGVTFLFIMATCVPAPITQPVLTPFVDTSTPTFTPSPTASPQPTLTPSPTATAIPTHTPWPTKEVLAQFGVFGGGGGWDYYAFIGGGMPTWILYTDGQFITQKQDDRGVWFEETTLTVPQMCSFLSQIEDIGFFTLPYDNSSANEMGIPTANPIYRFDSSTQFFEGGSHYVLQVNGTQPRQILIGTEYVRYLVPQAQKVFNFFDHYLPPSHLTQYQPKYLLLRIENGPGDSIYATPAPIAQTWPTNLPSLEFLAQQNIETAASGYSDGNSVRQALVENGQVEPIFAAFGDRMAYQLFQSEGQPYYASARPLLPHESTGSFSEFPQAREFDLPFSCSN